jgi:hypothetical protein
MIYPLAFLLATLPVQPSGSHTHTDLRSATPDTQVVRLDVDGDGKPDILERWWHGKRVRWLDESGTMQPGDLRGSLVNGTMQVDMDGDGEYDGPDDMNIRWCDTDGDGIPDVQAVIINPHQWGKTLETQTGHPVWMVWINHDKRGVLAWINWPTFDFACWDFTGMDDWLPNYHGNNDFVKTHLPVYAFTDPRINWENPFSFYDEDGDGVSEMVMRWCAPQHVKDGVVGIPPEVSSAFLAYDLDNNSGFGNETSYDMTLAVGGTNVSVKDMVHPLPHFKGNPKFDPCFNHNEWRRVTELIYMDRNKGYRTFFQTKWKFTYLTFDEDGDDHRWERVESLYPTTNYQPDGPLVDLYSTARFKNKEGLPPGIDGAFQSDSRGDRGDFDTDGSGRGQLYICPLDGKLHLFGAEWGAWTVDRYGEFHGGGGEPTKKPVAPKVGEVIKYTDTDGDGFFDTITFDYDGDSTTDLKVCLLDYKDKGAAAKKGLDPQKAVLYDPARLGWKGMHELFDSVAQSTWQQALFVYRAAWKKDLTTPEMDKMAASSSLRQRYMNAYWIKEDVFRAISAVLTRREGAHWKQLLADYTRAYYTGQFDKAVMLIAKI